MSFEHLPWWVSAITLGPTVAVVVSLVPGLLYSLQFTREDRRLRLLMLETRMRLGMLEGGDEHWGESERLQQHLEELGEARQKLALREVHAAASRRFLTAAAERQVARRAAMFDEFVDVRSQARTVWDPAKSPAATRSRVGLQPNQFLVGCGYVFSFGRVPLRADQGMTVEGDLDAAYQELSSEYSFGGPRKDRLGG